MTFFRNNFFLFLPAAFGCLLLQWLPLCSLASEPVTETRKTGPTDSMKTATGKQEISEISKSWMAEIQGINKQQKAPQGKREKQETQELPPQRLSPAHPKKTPPSETRLRNTGAQRTGLFPREEGPSFFSVLLRFIGLMAIFVGGFYFFARYVRRKGSGIFLGSQSELVEVLLSVPLVQGKFLQIVDVAGQLMILGVSEAGVQLLSEIKDGLVADKIRLWQSQRKAAPPPVGLLDSLTRTLKSADFAFWPASNYPTKSTEPSLNFKEFLDKESLGTQAPFLDSADNRPQPTGPTDEVDEIASMLKRHQHRLKSRKKKKSSP